MKHLSIYVKWVIFFIVIVISTSSSAAFQITKRFFHNDRLSLGVWWSVEIVCWLFSDHEVIKVVYSWHMYYNRYIVLRLFVLWNWNALFRWDYCRWLCKRVSFLVSLEFFDETLSWSVIWLRKYFAINIYECRSSNSVTKPTLSHLIYFRI